MPEEQNTEEIITKNKEETIFNKTIMANGKPHGESITYKKSGELIQKMNYSQGLLEGNLLLYYNGKIKSKIPFSKNLQNGEAKYYNENGNEIGVENYKNGVREGKTEWKDMDGNLIFTSNYKDGQLQGEYLEYDKCGKVKTRKQYDKGKLISQTEEALNNQPAKKKFLSWVSK